MYLVKPLLWLKGQGECTEQHGINQAANSCFRVRTNCISTHIGHVPLVSKITENIKLNLPQTVLSPETKYPIEAHLDGYVSINNSIQTLLSWAIHLLKD